MVSSCVSSQTWPLALVCVPKRRRPSFRVSPAVSAGWYSSDQILVSQPFAGRAPDEAIQPLRRVPLHVPFIEAERELVNVTMQVLVAGVVIDAVQATLRDRPNALDAVRRHAVIPRIFASAVNDGFMLLIVPEPRIAAMLVRVDGCTGFNALPDFRAQRLAIGPVNGSRHGAPAAFPHAQYDRLADTAATGMQLLTLVLVALFASDIGLVDFDNAAQLFELDVAAGLTETPKDEPSRLLGNADLLGELHRRNALASSDDEIHSVDPLVQRNMRSLEDRAGADGKILLALIAAVIAALARGNTVASAADGATRAIRPQTTLKPHSSCLSVRHQFEKLKGRNRALAHAITLRTCEDYSAFERGSQLYNSQIKAGCPL